jgi:hypothetical protein
MLRRSPKPAMRSIRQRWPRLVRCRVTGGHKIGYTLLKIAYSAPVQGLTSRPGACLGRRGSLVRIQSPRPLFEVFVQRLCNRFRLLDCGARKPRRGYSEGELVVPVHAGMELATGTLESILKKAGLK